MKKHIVLRTLFVSFFLLCSTAIAFPQTPFLWQQTNGPEGGSVAGLTIAPNGHVFAAVARGGVYRSTDNGASWTLANNGIGPPIGIGSMAINAQGTLFLTNGSDILRSSDNGENWSPTGFSAGALDIAVSPNGYIFAARGGWGAVARSTDGGEPWQDFHQGLQGTDVVLVAVGPTPGGPVYAGTRSGLFVSTNDGETWAPFGEVLQGIEITALDVDPSTGDVFVGTGGYGPKNGAMFRYDPGSLVWTMIPNPGIYQATAFAFKPDGHVFAATCQNSGVWMSASYGDPETWEYVGLGRWEDQANGMRSVRALAVNSSGKVFAGTNGDGVWRSTPDGRTWTRVAHGMKAADVWSTLVTADGGVLAGTGGAGIYRSADEGETWTQVALDTVNEGTVFRGMAMNSHGDIFAAWGGISRSTDGGRTWTPAQAIWYARALAISPSNEVYAGGVFYDSPQHYVGLMRSRDEGETWEYVDLPGADVWSLAIDPAGRIFAGGKGLWKSENNGATWSPVTGFENEYLIRAIAISPNGDVFVSCLTRNAVLRSSNGGQTWVEVFAYNAAVIAINSEGRVFAGFDGAVLSSTDNGNTWQEVNDGLMNLSIVSFAFDADGYLYSGHWGGGVSRTTETTFLVKTVAIDIKPGTYPNTINLGSGGTVLVAILSSETFDATTVDPLTVTLAGANVRLKGKGTPMSSFEDINKDGRLDLLVHVETEALELTDTSTEAVLEGKTFSGRHIKGTDTVKVVP
jgi:photosystem II stability/assembly factor-like uncharacterized protein